MSEWDAGEEVGGEGPAAAEQMGEVGTGVKMDGAVRWLGTAGKSEGIWWIDGKWQWRGLGN